MTQTQSNTWHNYNNASTTHTNTYTQHTVTAAKRMIVLLLFVGFAIYTVSTSPFLTGIELNAASYHEDATKGEIDEISSLVAEKLQIIKNLEQEERNRLAIEKDRQFAEEMNRQIQNDLAKDKIMQIKLLAKANSIATIVADRDEVYFSEVEDNLTYNLEVPDWADDKSFVFVPDYDLDGSTVNYYGWTEEDYTYLVMAITGENGVGDYVQQMYTGSALLNRVWHSDYPNTIKEVCLQPSQYTCFRKGGSAYHEPTELTKAVAYDLLKYGSILPHDVVYQAEFIQENNLFEEMDGTCYCYTSYGKSLKVRNK